MFSLILEAITTKGMQWKPQKITIDFEKSVINCVSNIFPSTKIQGCYFHFSQSVWRKVQGLGLVKEYKTQESVRKWVKRIAALPFVPEDRISDVFIYNMENAPDVAQAQEFHDYMVETWLDENEAHYPP